MKTAKLILSLILSFTLFNGCTVEETSINIIEDALTIEKDLIYTETPDSKEEKTDTKGTTNSANKMQYGDNNGIFIDGTEVLLQINTIEILVEYFGNVTQVQKNHARNIYGASIGMISYEELDNDSDLWVVNEALYTPYPIATCCPKVKSTEAESEDISLTNNWNDILLEALNTVNANY